MRCESCDIELGGGVVVTVGGRSFCCAGCAEGGPCGCSYEGQGLSPSRNGHADPVVTREFLRASGDSEESR